MTAASRPPDDTPPQVFVQPSWYLECRLHGHDADYVNVREGGGAATQCRIFRCRECDCSETVEPTTTLHPVAPDDTPPHEGDPVELDYQLLLRLKLAEAEVTRLRESDKVVPPTCTCWLGKRDATFGSSEERYYCRVHGDDTPHWQPIETAPRERYVLLTEVTEPSASDLHQHPDSQPIARTTVGRLAHWDGEWRWERYGIGNISTRRLTHWMPLPEPPHE
jgi:hypothetical protein